MRLHSFGNMLLPQLNAAHQLPVAFRSNTIDLRGGAYDMDGANTYLERKLLSATFWVSTQDVTDIDDYLDDLYAEAHSGRQILTAKMRDGTLRQAQVKLVQGITKPRSNIYIPDTITDLDGYEPMNVSFEMPYPYWREVDEAHLNYTAGAWVWDSGYGWESGQEVSGSWGGGTAAANLTIGGSVPTKNLIVTLEPNTGASCSNVVIKNASQLSQVTYTGTVAANEVLTLKALPQHIDLDGTGVYENLTVPDDQIQWWDMKLGINQFQVSGTVSGVVTITYQWQNHWVR